MSSPLVAFDHYLADLTDPRVDRTRKHLLGDILVIAVCAVIAGADSFPEIETFGKAKESWLRRSLPLPSGIPSHDTFNRVFAALDPEPFAACFFPLEGSGTVHGPPATSERIFASDALRAGFVFALLAPL